MKNKLMILSIILWLVIIFGFLFRSFEFLYKIRIEHNVDIEELLE